MNLCSEHAHSIHAMHGLKPDQAYISIVVTAVVCVTQIADSLSLPAIRDRPWQIQPCCAKSGEGLKEGMEWLIKQVQ